MQELDTCTVQSTDNTWYYCTTMERVAGDARAPAAAGSMEHGGVRGAEVRIQSCQSTTVRTVPYRTKNLYNFKGLKNCYAGLVLANFFL